MLLDIAIATPFLLFLGAALLTLLAAAGLRWGGATFGETAIRVLAEIVRSLPAMALLTTLAGTGYAFALIWGDEDGLNVGERLAAMLFLSMPASLSLAAFVASRLPVSRLTNWSIWMSATLIVGFGVIMVMSIGVLYMPAGLMLLVAAIARLALSDSSQTVAPIPRRG